MRPDFDIYAMRIAYIAAMRATCPRRSVGAVIMDREHRIVATGYNGSARKQESCNEVGCQIVDGHCVRTLHAESNCLDFAGRFAAGCTLYGTVTPCWDCAKRIVNSGLDRVVYDEHYESRYGKSMDVPDFLDRAGLEVTRLDAALMARFKAAIKDIDTVPNDLVVTPAGGVPLVSPALCAIHRFHDDVCVMCGTRDD
jgi:dCMP deaminase